MDPKTFDKNGICLFCRKCKRHRTFYSKFCTNCNQDATDSYIAQMVAQGWTLVWDKNGIRRLR